jgi:hypothetical protein
LRVVIISGDSTAPRCTPASTSSKIIAVCCTGGSKWMPLNAEMYTRVTLRPKIGIVKPRSRAT